MGRGRASNVTPLATVRGMAARRYSPRKPCVAQSSLRAPCRLLRLAGYHGSMTPPTVIAPAPTANERERALLGELRALQGAPVLAYSGGVDSSYLLALLAESRGAAGFLAVIGVSASLSARQLAQARAVAALLAVPLQELGTRELERPEYRANLGDRCFFCKDTLFGALRALHGAAVIFDGSQLDDRVGHRPGREAARLHGVRSPLLDAGIGKADIRALSAQRGLPTADLPATPCLASRFPAGTPVSEEGLARVEAAEELLRALGFRELRVRHHDGGVARIEVPQGEAARLLGTPLGAAVSAGLKSLGFRFVTLDLEGFRSGSSSTLA